MSFEVRRGTVLSFDTATWTALVLLDGADLEAQMPVGQWIPSAMMAADADVAVLVMGQTNTDDGVVLGPYGAVSLWNFPAIGSASNGALLIGNGSGMVLATITGTANRVTVTNGAGTITLSGPQDLAAASSPTFAGLTLNGAITDDNNFLAGYEANTLGVGSSLTLGPNFRGLVLVSNASDNTCQLVICRASGTVASVADSGLAMSLGVDPGAGAGKYGFLFTAGAWTIINRYVAAKITRAQVIGN